MKLDRTYSFIHVCPKTGSQLTRTQHADRDGVCCHCGDNNGSTFTHGEKAIGQWNRPSLWEQLRGKRAKFVRKPVEPREDKWAS